MKNLKRLMLCCACFGAFQMLGQSVTFNKTKYAPIKKIGEVDVSTLEDEFLGHLEYVEAPNVSGNAYKMHLADVKKEVAAKYPRNDKTIPTLRGDVNPPDILEGYKISGINVGSPIDNHLAMFDKYIVSAGNFYMAISNSTGGIFKTFTLNAFGGAAGINAQPFDPRLVFDPINERFVLTFLAGFDSQNTDIVIAFSETEDPRGKWNIYSLPGNPNGLDQWTDYPMLAMTNDDIFLTINLLKDGESWQLGFIETIIWQIDKSTGYDDLDLAVTKWDGIQYGGQNIRNLCPAESAVDYFDDMYFISNRNFAIDNDTFFMVKLAPNATAGEEITVAPILSDNTYGAPPNAIQPQGELQSNDARVLEAFRHNDEIQFVGNSRNPTNNRCGIYHGIIADINAPDGVLLNHIIGNNFEVGYPGITYTGDGFDERDAIINFNHTGLTRDPGTSAVYSIPDYGYSPIVETAKGENYVDMFPAAAVERWGDYCGSQRDFDNPDEVWVAGYIGNTNRANAPFIRRLRRPSIQTGTNDNTAPVASVKTYPNPTIDRFTVDIDLPTRANHILVTLNDISGQLISNLYESNHAKAGQNRLSFNSNTLTSGSYIVKVLLDRDEVINKTIIIK